MFDIYFNTCFINLICNWQQVTKNGLHKRPFFHLRKCPSVFQVNFRKCPSHGEALQNSQETRDYVGYATKLKMNIIFFLFVLKILILEMNIFHLYLKIILNLQKMLKISFAQHHYNKWEKSVPSLNSHLNWGQGTYK